MQSLVRQQRSDIFLQQCGLQGLIGGAGEAALHTGILFQTALAGQQHNGFAINQLVYQHGVEHIRRHAAHFFRQRLRGVRQV